MPQLPPQPPQLRKPIMASRVANAYKNNSLLGHRPAAPVPPRAAGSGPLPAPPPPASRSAGAIRSPCFAPAGQDLKPIGFPPGALPPEPEETAAALPPEPLKPPAGLVSERPVSPGVARARARGVMDMVQRMMGAMHRQHKQGTPEYRQLLDQFKRLSGIVKVAAAEPEPVAM